MPSPGQSPTRPIIPQPPHLAEVEAAEKAQAEAERSAEQPTLEQLTERRGKRRLWFEVDYTDIEGRRWQGRFLSVIPTMLDEIEIEKMTARLSHGTGEADLPGRASAQISALAYLTVCLKERPEWAANLGQLPEPAVFELLAEEVQAHLTCFQQRRQRLSERTG